MGRETLPSPSPLSGITFRHFGGGTLSLLSKKPRSTFHSVYDDKKVPPLAPLRNLVPGITAAKRERGGMCVEKERETKERVRGAMISRCNRYDLSHGVVAMVVVVAICASVDG